MSGFTILLPTDKIICDGIKMTFCLVTISLWPVRDRFLRIFIGFCTPGVGDKGDLSEIVLCLDT